MALRGQRRDGPGNDIIEHLSPIAEIDRRISLAKAHFGKRNLLIPHLMEVKLITLLLEPSLDELSITTCASTLHRYIFPPDEKSIGISKRQFNIIDYEEEYEDLWSEYESELSKSTKSFRGNINPYEKYIYVVGRGSKWRHLTAPQPIEVSVSGRRNPEKYPFHPFLSREFNHDVIAAGEISVIWNKSNPSPDMIYINNISGHFKPSWITSDDLYSIAEQIFPYTRKSRVMSICNNGYTFKYGDNT